VSSSWQAPGARARASGSFASSARMSRSPAMLGHSCVRRSPVRHAELLTPACSIRHSGTPRLPVRSTRRRKVFFEARWGQLTPDFVRPLAGIRTLRTSASETTHGCDGTSHATASPRERQPPTREWT
jgi:hypothetical protein